MRRRQRSTGPRRQWEGSKTGNHKLRYESCAAVWLFLHPLHQHLFFLASVVLLFSRCCQNTGATELRRAAAKSVASSGRSKSAKSEFRSGQTGGALPSKSGRLAWAMGLLIWAFFSLSAAVYRQLQVDFWAPDGSDATRRRPLQVPMHQWLYQRVPARLQHLMFLGRRGPAGYRLAVYRLRHRIPRG